MSGTSPTGTISIERPTVQSWFPSTVPDIIAGLRAVKSPTEIALHRKAGEINDIGHDVLFRESKAGNWGHQVVAKAIGAMRAEGADYAHFWMRSTPPDDVSQIIDQRRHDRLP